MVSNLTVKGVNFHKTYNTVWREVLYNIFLEYGLPMKLIRLKNVLMKPIVKSGWDTFLIIVLLRMSEMGRCSVNVALQLCCRTVIMMAPANHEE